MAKLVGYGNYEPVLDEHGLYTRARSLGAAPAGYDLNLPGAVTEIKAVLVELAKYFADPVNRPNPATEDAWQHIDRSVEYADAWDGPTADEFVIMVGRLRNDVGPLIGNPAYTQLVAVEGAQGTSSIVGGPQPTVAGLELLAQGAHKYLKGLVNLDHYLAWRGGSLDSWFDGPPDSFVLQSHKAGRPWDRRGWTVAWRDGPAAVTNPSLLSQLDLVDNSIKTSWAVAQQLTNEPDRATRAQILANDRSARNDIVMQLNQGAPDPTCAEGFMWSRSAGRCVSRCTGGMVWDSSAQACAVQVLPQDTPLYENYSDCVDQHVASGFEPDKADELCSMEFPNRASPALVAGAAIAVGVGAWLYFKRRRAGGSASVVDWEMKAPKD